MKIGPFSPSSLEEFEKCPRKWAWRKILGIVSLPSAAQAFGLKLHRHLELWLRDAQPIDQTCEAGKAAFAGIHLLPRPGTALVETPMALEYGGQKFHGIPDVCANGAETSDLRVNIPIVFDHKNTADHKWAKTPDDLRVDLQACLYAYSAMLRYGSQSCHLRWIYYRRNKPYRALPVDVAVTFGDIKPTLDRAVSLAERMAYVLTNDFHPLHLPPHVDHCGAFNGCPHQLRCTDLTPEKRMISLMSNQTPDATAFFAALEQQKAAAGGAPPAGPPPSPGYQHHPQDPNFVWYNGTWTHVSQVPPPGAPPPAPPPAINPPPVAGPPPAQPAAMTTIVHNAPPVGVAPAVQPSASAAPPAGATASPEATPTKKRGRPKGSKNATAAAPAGAPTVDDDFWSTVAGMLRAAADYLDGAE